MSKFKISYDVWRQVRLQQPQWPVYRHCINDENAHIYTGNARDQFVSFIEGDQVTDFEQLVDTVTEVSKPTDALALLAASKFSPPSDGTRTPDGKLVVSTYPTVGNRVNIVTHRWNDPTTWVENAEYAAAEQAQRLDARTYKLNHLNVIDVTHGKVWKEDFITPDNGAPSYQPQVRVNGTPQGELVADYTKVANPQDHGDWSMDYAAGTLTFFEDIPPDAVVEVDYWYATISTYIIEPLPGKQLDLDQVEIQFAQDTSLRDTTVFKIKGWAAVFAPHLVEQGVLGPQDLVPLRDPVHYKSMADFCNEANGMLPLIPNMTPPERSWRDFNHQILTFPWNYQAVIQLKSSWGMRVEMSLLNHIPHHGSFATVTVYGLSNDE